MGFTRRRQESKNNCSSKRGVRLIFVPGSHCPISIIFLVDLRPFQLLPGRIIEHLLLLRQMV